MFGKKIKIFTLLGFEVSIDSSWFFIAFLITWSLAVGFFPKQYPSLLPATYWAMGLIGAVGLFLSVILHELSHSLIARKYGLSMKGITLFIFGGVAEMAEEPANAKTEFAMAAAGPLASVLISLFFFYMHGVGYSLHWAAPVMGVIDYLAYINIALALFNLLPAFPLDGGRILRAILWSKRKNIRSATLTASKIGSAFGTFFILLGLLNLFLGNFIGAMWWALIGFFLKGSARLSYQQVLTQEVLAGESVSHFMTTQPITVSPTLTLEDFVYNYVYHYHHKMFPVLEEDRLLGLVQTQQLKSIPRDQWREKHVADILQASSPENTLPFHEDAKKALALMHQTGNSRLLIVDQNRLAGIISLKDILKFLSLKLDLEGTLPA